jgi:hypothetical protein
VNEDERKYLDLLQGVITRLGGNSFQLKGWSVALASVIIGLTAKDSHPTLSWLALIPVGAFWVLDAYYLAMERLYRERYVAAVPALQTAAQPPVAAAKLYDMNVGDVRVGGWWSAFASRSVMLAHLPIALVALAVMVWGLSGH